MKTSFDTADISLTTVQGYSAAFAYFLMGLIPVFIMYGHPRIASGCGLAGAIIGVFKAAVGQLQQDATKPTDGQGKPVPSSEVPVKQ